MIKVLLFLLENLEYSSANIDRARGRYKYPENWKEFKRYIKYKYNHR